jgi:ubiquinone/menaquinone biosynthesis C-methylase UbiE
MQKNIDTIRDIFKMEYMDDMHEYPSFFSNVRYYHRLKARIVRKFLENNQGLEKTFLDAGSGRGPYCLLASSFFKKVYCDEYDKEELSKAEIFIKNKNVSNVEFLNNDLTKPSYGDNSIDIIVCSEVLEHIPEREKAAAELYRILKPGGTLLLSMPQKNSLFYWNVRRIHKETLKTPEPKNSNEDLWHFMQHLKFSHRDIENIAKNAGFTIIKRYGANVLPLGEALFSKIYKIPLLFKMYIYLEFILEKMFPKSASFYFIELTKKHD